MTEAYWGDTTTPDIDWRMSAALEDVPRGDSEVAEVANLATSVRAWLALDAQHRAAATLTLEHPVQIDTDGPTTHFSGAAIQALADLLPSASPTPDAPEDPSAA